MASQTNDGSRSDDKTEKRRSRLWRRLMWWGIGVVLFFAVLAAAGTVTPKYLARALLSNELDALGVKSEGIDTVDVNIWTQEIWFGPVSLGRGDEDAAKIKRVGLSFSLFPLFQGRVLGDEILIDGVDLRLLRTADGRLAVNGIPLAVITGGTDRKDEDARSEEDGWGFGVNRLRLRDSTITFGKGTLRPEGTLVVRLDRVNLRQFKSWEPGDAGRFTFTARINEINLDLEGEATPFAEEIKVRANSKLTDAEIVKVERFLGPLNFIREKGRMSAEISHTLNIAPGGRVEMSHAGSMDVEDVDVAREGQPPIGVDRGKINLDIRQSLGPSQRFRISGGLTLEAEGLSTQLSDGRSAKTNGLKLMLEGADIALGGNSGGTGPAIAATKAAIEVRGGELNWKDETVAKVSVAQAEANSFSLDEEAERTVIRADNVTIGELNTGFTQRLFAFFSATQGRTPASNAVAGAPVKDGQSGKTLSLRVRTLTMKEKGSVRFTDNTDSGKVEIAVLIERLSLLRPKEASADTMGDLDFSAKLNEFTSVTVKGKADPLRADPQFDLTANVNGLSLPTFSPYAERLAGVHLEQGRLGANGKGTLAQDGKLDAEVKVKMEDIKFKKLDPEAAKQLRQEAGGVPLETAVALLEDSKGKIDLTIPISGDIDDPKFDLGQVTRKAVGGAIANTVTTTLKIIFPPAFLISAAMDKKSGIQFKPVSFEPQTTVIPDSQDPLLKSVADLLRKRPRLKINVCGQATAADMRAYLSERLLTGRKDNPRVKEQAAEDLDRLAKERTAAVRNALTARFGIVAERVSECRASFNENDKGPPRADLRL